MQGKLISFWTSIIMVLIIVINILLFLRAYDFVRQRRAAREAAQPGSLSNEMLTEVITEIRHMWPDCRMVRGSPRHSESNGGVERVNQTVQTKLGTWMRDTHSRRWSVGCRVVMWRYNTQIHRTLGNIPYRLLFGQLPRVGISSLLLDAALIDSLSTEAQLNRVIQYEGMVEAVDTDDENDVNEDAAQAAFEAMIDAGEGGEEVVQEAALDAGDDDAEQVVQEEALDAGGDDAVLDAEGEEGGEETVLEASGESAGVGVEEAVEDRAVSRDLFGAAAYSASAAAAQNKNNNDNNESASDSDDDLTLEQLRQSAETKERDTAFKTTGDENFTAWQVLRSEMSTSTIINYDHLLQMKLKDKVPIAYCVNASNISEMESFVPAILIRVQKKLWEVMDENDDQMEEQLEWDGDNGIANMVGLYIKHPDKSFCDYFQSLKGNTKRAEDDKVETVTPRRGEMRKRAHEQMSKAAASMKKAVIKRVGNEKVCEVGEVVHVPLKDMDKAKVDTGNLTGVIVQVDKGRSQARVAVKSGLLKSWYVYHRLGRVTGAGNNVELNGLTDALANWKTMPVIAEREAARNESMVGGQGKGDVTCNCRGPCNTKQCSCKKAGRICTSACHRNNMKCVNHDRGEK
jgi:hypothetical protein